MNLQKMLMTVALTAAGVIAAGAAMKYAKDIGIIDVARDGFSKGI